MDGYLSKPIERRALFEAVLRWAQPGAVGKIPMAAMAPASPPADAGRPAATPRQPADAVLAAAEAQALPAEIAALAVLDERVIAALASDLSDALMPEVVATFVEEARERIDAIEQAVENGDCAGAARQGHALKGSAATFGAVALREMALAIERSGRDGALDPLRSQVASLRTCGETVLRELLARYGGEAAAS
jgi:HPt (histidine-containing phosphotransfer) domain-containing protein